MSPVRRTKVLRAYELRCQGLTIRQIAAEMDCAPSTVLKYLRDFDAYRAEIIESLAAEQLVRSLQQLDSADQERHDRQIAATREFRLLLESLDRTADRRQRRERRIHENHVQDLEREHQQIYEIVETMLKYGYWDPEEDMSDFFEPVFGPRHNPDAPKPNLPSAPQADAPPIPLSPPAARVEMSRSDRGGRPPSPSRPPNNPQPTAHNHDANANNNEQNQHKREQNRTKPNRIPANPQQNKANRPNPSRIPLSHAQNAHPTPTSASDPHTPTTDTAIPPATAPCVDRQILPDPIPSPSGRGLEPAPAKAGGEPLSLEPVPAQAGS